MDGTIDIIATDHAPHAPEEKTRPDIWTVDCGFPGVETQMPLMLTEVNRGRATLEDYVRWSAENPAKIWGLYPRKGALTVGSDADIAIVDINREWTIDDALIQSRSKISPWQGRKATALPIHTLVRGRFVMKDRVLQENARGSGRSGACHPADANRRAAQYRNDDGRHHLAQGKLGQWTPRQPSLRCPSAM
jgi:dihydroorotase